MEAGTSPAPTSSASKRGLQDLSKEELVQKCKGLLNLAQKAKQAKDGKIFERFLIDFLCLLLSFSSLSCVHGAGF